MNGSQNTYLNGLVVETAPLLALAGGWTCRERFEKWLKSEHKGEDPNGVN